MLATLPDLRTVYRDPQLSRQPYVGKTGRDQGVTQVRMVGGGGVHWVEPPRSPREFAAAMSEVYRDRSPHWWEIAERESGWQ